MINFREYRAAQNPFCKKTCKLYKQVVDNDGHSGGSYAWTQRQSEYIDKHGWDVWWQTDGPLGYGVYFKKCMDFEK